MTSTSQPESLPLDPIVYLWTCPGTADFGFVSEEEFGERVAATKLFPENIRRALVSEESAQKVENLALRKHGLPLGAARRVAKAIGRILRGEESAANLHALLSRDIDAPIEVLGDIARSLTKEFITPNYFQIAQVYEKKHKGEVIGTPLRPSGFAGRGRQQETDVRPATPTGPPPAPPRATPPRVIDLRNGGIPSKLPPPPAPLRGTEDIGPRPAPTSPPPPKPAVPPDLPLERLTPTSSPNPPSPPSSPPRPSGTHGSLPVLPAS